MSIRLLFVPVLAAILVLQAPNADANESKKPFVSRKPGPFVSRKPRTFISTKTGLTPPPRELSSVRQNNDFSGQNTSSGNQLSNGVDFDRPAKGSVGSGTGAPPARRPAGTKNNGMY